ncbi:UNVERIFIED_CONTAM: hypothetical protein Slati_1753100 [Sesamum latifolium]|uniref:DUF8040 domain-containing protein n=1 Tax=Sesamum latifolium TaxID=2727402 RepID=A0AAW2X0Q2_9LAMI
MQVTLPYSFRQEIRMRSFHRILALIAVQKILVEIAAALAIFLHVIQYIELKRRSEQCVRRQRYKLNSRIPDQVRNLHRLVSFNDESCLQNLCMDCNALGCLCYMLEQLGGVKPTKNLIVPEQMGTLFSVVSHHKKNCVVKHDFLSSGRTVSKHFHAVLHAVCKMHTFLLVRSIPITEDCLDLRWK